MPPSSISVVNAYGELADGWKVLFNFTVDKDHGIKSKALNNFLNEWKDEAFLYVWIVPPDIEPLFNCET